MPPLSEAKMAADTAALHRDFDRGEFFLDAGGVSPVPGFLIIGEESQTPFEKGTRSVNQTFAFHTPVELKPGTTLYQITGGVHADTWQVQSQVEMDGASVYALRNVHRITSMPTPGQ